MQDRVKSPPSPGGLICWGRVVSVRRGSLKTHPQCVTCALHRCAPVADTADWLCPDIAADGQCADRVQGDLHE